MKKKLRFDYLVPVIAVIAFTALNFTGFYKTAENRIYDMFLHIKPEIPENGKILFLDVDDLSIERVGVWPWSRHIMADGLILMKEFGAGYAVFDIEYTQESPRGINSTFLEQELPELFSDEFKQMNMNITDLFTAIHTGAIPLSDANDYINDLTGLNNQVKAILLEKVAEISRDNDDYLGRSAGFFENAYFTVTMIPKEADPISADYEEWIENNIAMKKVTVDAGVLKEAKTIRPAIIPILSRSAGAGFPNIIIDNDGVRRRVELVNEYKEHYFSQLVFTPLLDWLGNPEVEVGKNEIILKGAVIPEKGEHDITIPLAEDGTVLINWLKKGYADSFKHLSYYYLYLHSKQEQLLIKNLKLMEADQYFSYYEEDQDLLAAYNYAESIKNEILNGESFEYMQDWRDTRDYFFTEAGNFLNGSTEGNITSVIDEILASDEYSDIEKEEYRAIRREVENNFKEVRLIYSDLVKTREILKEKLPGSFCIIGSSATSTFDRGVNPFEKEYANIGTHASLVNCIIEEEFLDDFPWWQASIIALILAFLVYFIIRKLNPLPSILIGIAVIILFIAAGAVYFMFTGVYSNILTPTASVVTTFIVLTLLSFLNTAKEKTYIKNAFGQYLSVDVINDLLLDPDKLTLGGEKKDLTALFTDVQGFSTISEKLDPTDLVKILNSYLTEMSNIILDLKGTIDKYEGDAIISFFGAPVALEDHAERACRAAIRMKKIEKQINKHLLEENMSPNPLFTRIGINTGEMVVGNMGTAQKMDYTIMGNAVNLAARLEGVNKQYGTWLLISEPTYLAGGKEFATRKLDRVRVVGISQPVRLYELLDEKDSLDSKIKDAVEVFQFGLILFEKGDWDEAKKVFKKVLNTIPDDGPSKTFIKRCIEYKKKPPADSWNGVFNLTLK